jgi:actin-like protein 6A
MRQAIEAKGATVRPRYSFRRVDAGGGTMVAEELDLANTTESYREYQVDAICQDVKHAICRVSDAPFDPEENASIPTVTYELPDGQEIQVGADRFTVPETLFNPSLLSGFGDVGKGVRPLGGADSLQALPAVVADCISRSDIDVRRDLYGGVVLTGGTSLFASLRDRLEKELTESAPQMIKVRVTCPTNAIERRYSTWIGGSILASLGTFQQMWMSKEEYKEAGAGLIHKKAP